MNETFMEKKQHTEDQHTVPVFLLKQFSINNKTLCVWDRKENRFFYRTAESICVVKDLYDEKWQDVSPELGKYVFDNMIEDSFVDEEGRMSTLSKSIRRAITDQNIILLSESDTALIKDFVVDLYLRTPVKMQEIIDYYSGMDNEPKLSVLNQEAEMFFSTMNWGSPKSLINYSKKFGIFSREIEGSPFNAERKRMDGMKYVFWYSQDGNFITSSFPLYFVSNDLEIINRLIVPISSHIAIVLFDRLPFGLEQGIVLTPQEEVIKYNMKLFVKAYPVDTARFFIAKDEKTLSALL